VAVFLAEDTMPIIDFREVPEANTGKGDQDTFELLARDFFQALGFEIGESPSRGADGGKDLIIFESLVGSVSATKRRWVVSCKHNARSGKAVGDRDEIDVLGRVRKFKADGFMGFYSTLPSNGLMQTLRSHESEIAIHLWDRERIESELVSDKRLQMVFKRYFPDSYDEWRRNSPRPARVFGEYDPLACSVCGKDLLQDRSGVIGLAIKFVDNKKHVLDVYWACRGHCDRVKQQEIWHSLETSTGWEGLDDLSIPLVYVRWFISTFNNLRNGDEVFTDEAFEKFKEFTMAVSQIVVRETTAEQWQRLEQLAEIPAFIGGLRD
jgi:hypothetical protein